MALVVRIQLPAHGVRDGIEQIIEQGTVVQAELAVREQGLAFGQIMLRFQIHLQRGALSMLRTRSRRCLITSGSP